MISALVNPIIKGLLVAVVITSAVACLTTNLYLGTRDDLVLLESTHRQLKQDFRDCSEGKERHVLSAQQDDTIISSKQEKIDSLVREKDALVSKLNNIPKKTCNPPISKNLRSEDETLYVDIDAPFDDEYKRVFEQLGNKNSGSSSVNP